MRAVESMEHLGEFFSELKCRYRGITDDGPANATAFATRTGVRGRLRLHFSGVPHSMHMFIGFNKVENRQVIQIQTG